MSSNFYTAEELCELGFASLGENVLISKKTSIYSPHKISIGNNVRIDDFCVLSGNIKIGNYVHIAVYSALFAGDYGIVLNDFVGVSSRCVIYAQSDDYSGNFLTNPTVPQEYKNIVGGKVVLEKHVILGTGVSVMPGVTIGEGSAVGSMSFVNKSLEVWTIYTGIPCKKMKPREKKLLTYEKKLK